MNYLRSQKGNTLTIAILILVLASVIGLSLISMSINGLQRNEVRKVNNEARELAEKGMTHISALLEKKIEEIIPEPQIAAESKIITKFNSDLENILKPYYCSQNVANHLSQIQDNQHQYRVCIEDLDDDDFDKNPLNLIVRSTGIVNGEEIVVRSSFELKTEFNKYPDTLRYAVATHSQGNLMLNGGIEITGDVLADGNVIVSEYGFAPVIDSKYSLNPWKLSVLPKINGLTKEKQPIIKINNQKRLFIANVDKFYGACKKYNSILPEILTYNELRNYDFNNINDTTKCLFQMKNPAEISSNLNFSKSPALESTFKIDPIDVKKIIDKGKENLSSVNKGSYNRKTSLLIYKSDEADSPTIVRNMLQTTSNVTLKGDYKIPSYVATSLTSSTLDGDFYFENANLNLIVGSKNVLKGRFYFEKPLALESNLKIWGGEQTLDGEFYLEKTTNNPNGIADGLDNAIEIDNGKHKIKGIYYVNGDVRIKSSTIEANAIFYVNGDVQIEHSNVKSLDDDGKLIIFANGDIVYQYASEFGESKIGDYHKNEVLELNAFLYSNKKIELHGTLSNIRIKGGIAAKQIFLSGVRGQVEKGLLGYNFKNIDNLNENSRLRIEYDENVIKTIQELSNSKDYSSTVSYTELIVQPLRQVSREIVQERELQN